MFLQRTAKRPLTRRVIPRNAPLTSSYSRGPAASLVALPSDISCVADPEEACVISKAPGSEHDTVTDLYDRIGHTHLLESRSLTAKAGSQHGSPRETGCKFGTRAGEDESAGVGRQS